MQHFARKNNTSDLSEQQRNVLNAVLNLFVNDKPVSCRSVQEMLSDSISRNRVSQLVIKLRKRGYLSSKPANIKNSKIKLSPKSVGLLLSARCAVLVSLESGKVIEIG